VQEQPVAQGTGRRSENRLKPAGTRRPSLAQKQKPANGDRPIPAGVISTRKVTKKRKKKNFLENGPARISRRELRCRKSRIERGGWPPKAHRDGAKLPESQVLSTRRGKEDDEGKKAMSERDVPAPGKMRE